MAADNAGDGNALLKRHAPQFSTAFARAVKSGRITSVQAAKLEGLGCHSKSVLLPKHLAKIEKSLKNSRDVRAPSI